MPSSLNVMLPAAVVAVASVCLASASGVIGYESPLSFLGNSTPVEPPPFAKQVAATLASYAAAPFAVVCSAFYAAKVCAMLLAFVMAAGSLTVLLAHAPKLVSSSVARGNAAAAVGNTWGFYASLYHYIVRGGRYPAPYFAGNTQARVQIFSLALVFQMWSRPHYRNGTFREDMVKNLRNVALPGTGLPLSVLCCSKVLAYVCLLVGYPAVAMCAALIREGRASPKMLATYSQQLLNPRDWFSFWRLNCRLATFHAAVTGERGYDLEDKWEFIQTAEANDIAISPCLKMPKLIVKHRNEEGGLGFYSFKNAAGMPNGEWLIQEHLENDAFVSAMLPDDAPLSTFRVMSASRCGLPSSDAASKKKAAKGSEEEIKDVEALSCVFRAGRQGAITDHVSVLFDVDKQTGEIGRGTTNAHWYQLGVKSASTTAFTAKHDIFTHPDTGKQVTGTVVPDIKGMLDFVRRAHARMCPGVPVIGWDVALTTKGMLLLEANYSSNFFRGTFDRPAYFSMVDDYFSFLDARQHEQAAIKAE